MRSPQISELLGSSGRKAPLSDGTAEESLQSASRLFKIPKGSRGWRYEKSTKWVVNEHSASVPFLHPLGWSGKEETCLGPCGDLGTEHTQLQESAHLSPALATVVCLLKSYSPLV